MEYTLRPIKHADREPMVKVFNYFAENSFAAYFSRPVGPEFFERFYRMCVGYPFLAIETEDKQFVGFGCLHPFHAADSFRHTAEVTYFILPEHTGAGLGTRLLNEFFDWAKRNEISIIIASISSKNDQSIAFHKKHGFAETGRLKGIGLKRGEPFDVVWMQKSL
ncbi:MAG: N-acetyltransferase family protein [Candidatus Zixiibacteriota bacterium]